MPLAASGSMIWTSVRHELAPSTRAASTISGDTCRKMPRMMMMLNARLRVM